MRSNRLSSGSGPVPDGGELRAADPGGTLPDRTRRMRLPAYLAPDAPNPARYPANPLHGCQRQGIPLSRSGDKERIDPKPQTGRRPVTSESGNSLRTVPAFLCFFVFCFRQRTVRPSHAKHIGHLANTLRTSSYLSSVPILERSADPVQGADAFFGQDDVVVPFRLQRYEA